MNYIITKTPQFFEKIGNYNFCALEQLTTLPEEIAFDTETTGLFAKDCDIFCCQIGTGKDNYIIHMYDNNYSFNDVIPYIKNKTLVMQNGLFDLGFMYKYNFIPEKVFDTMLASKIIYNGDYVNQRSDFASLMKRELGIVYDKTDQKNIHIVKLSQASAIKYSFNDVDKLLELHNALLKKIEENGSISTYLLHCRFIKALAYIEQCGLPINSEKWMNKMLEDEANVLKYKTMIEEYIFEKIPKFANNQLDFFRDKKEITINLKSPQQMISIFNELGIETKDKDGKNSINENIISKSKHEFVQMWLNYQAAQHRVSTFGNSIYDKIIDGRIYTNFNPMVDTARLSSRKGGINFLNFPSDKETRNCFEAVPGNKMIVCDWAGQETVIMADVSKDIAMTKSVVEGADLHCLLARELYPEIKTLSDDEIKKKHADKRTKAKAPRFTMQYGGNGYTLHINENIPLREAEDIFEKFINLHEGLFAWGEKVLKKAIRLGYIESVDGWKLKLPQYDWFSDLHKKVSVMSTADWNLYRAGKAERQREYMIEDSNKNLKKGEPKKVFKTINEPAYNYYKSKRKDISDYFSLKSQYKRLALNSPIQTCGAHQIKLALCYIFEWIVENNYMWTILMCNAVHDETVCEAPENLSTLIKEKIEEFMRKAGNHYLTDLTIQADAGIGQTWYEAK